MKSRGQKNKNKKITPNPQQNVEVAKRIRLPWHYLLIGLLMILQAVLVYPLLQDGYTRFIESIEGAHVANAKFILEHWFDSWNNQWYFGFPVHLTYPPVVPNLMALSSWLTGISLSQCYRIIVAIFMILTPVSMYVFILELTKRKTTAFLASLMYILLPSIAYLVIPQITPNLNLNGWVPYQLIVLTQYGEGPHLVSLFFLPLAARYFIRSYRQPDVYDYVMCSIFFALTMLTNLFGGFAWLIVMVILILGKLAIYLINFNWRRLLLICGVAYALTAFAYDFGFIQSIIQSGYIHPENAIHFPPFLIVFLFILFVVLPAVLFLRHKMMGNESNYPWFVAICWTLVFLTVGAVYYHTGYSLLTQPNRYLPEAQIGAVILLAMFMTNLLDRAIDYDDKWRSAKHVVVIGAIFGLIALLSSSYWMKPYALLKPMSMNTTYEYKIAQWLDKNINRKTGERVYLTGTPSFWFNTFTDAPQIRGGADNAQPNPWWADVAYQINKGSDEAIVKSWLNILNVKYALINYPESGTHYVDYENFDRFANWETVTEFADGGYKLKKVPDTNTNLFVVANEDTAKENSPIGKVTSKERVLAWADILNKADNSRLEYQILSPGRYEVKVKNWQPGEAVIFKMNYDPRWKVLSKANIKIEPIGPNFVMLTSNQNGDITFNLSITKTWTEYLGIIMTIGALAWVIWMLWKRTEKLID